ncbi:MAG: hypothetical protein BGO49_10670 [Planctomycetales bacterium 71-10]|nr:MAG: hypothetical protein BGO49_10670 [Planctomycetales bacterium 71-10]
MMATRSVAPSAGPGSPLKLTCPCCGKVHELPFDVAGRKVRCGGCGEKYRMPKGDGPLVRIPRDDATVVLPGPIPAPRKAEAPPKAKPRPRPAREPEPEPSSEFEVVVEDVAPPPRAMPTPAAPPKVRRRPGPIMAEGKADWKKTAVSAVLTVAFVLGLGGRIYRRYLRAQGGATTATASAPSPSPDAPASAPGPIAMPPLPEVGPGRAIEPGVVLHESRLPGGDAPGWGGKLWLYLPEGEHAPRSLPCVMITAAGSTLLTGNSIGEDSRPEHVPYVRAGFAVLAYDMDGDPGDARPNPGDARFREAARKFLAARAGLVNAHVAMEFLRAKVPQVDPDRIFAAGHSSAGTAALIFAEEEPRLKGCVAYAPATNLIKRFGPSLPEIGANGWGDLVDRYSPMNEGRERRIACPVFLFHAEGDEIAPAADTHAFAGSLRSYGKDVRLETIPGGDHYESMLDPGIPKAIAWLREVAARAASPATPAPAPAAVATAKAPVKEAHPAAAGADRLVPMRDGRPVVLPATAAGAMIANFRFVDAAQDRVGTGGGSAGRPDGRNDMHFYVELDLPPGTTVDQMSLAVDDDQHRWGTRPDGRSRFLGVERDGRPAIPGFAEPIGAFSGRQAFDLYGESDLPPRTAFRLGVALTIDGRPAEIGAVCVRP